MCLYKNIVLHKILVIENCATIKRIVRKFKAISKRCLNQRETIASKN